MKHNILVHCTSGKWFDEKEEKLKENAKNYPYWAELVSMMRAEGHTVTQIGRRGDRAFGANKFLEDRSFDKIAELVDHHDFFISVDSFLPHLVHQKKIGTPGFVIFSVSDPKLFGYPENFNHLKADKFLRDEQWGVWKGVEFNEAAFDKPEKIWRLIKEKFIPNLVTASHEPLKSVRKSQEKTEKISE